MKRVNINLSNRILYSLITIGILILLGIGVFAYGTSNPPVFGHSAGEIDGLPAAIPPGAVMAFNLASCPSGWSAYTAGVNRMIVGSGSSYSLGATGGAATHVLTVNEMPAHTHGLAYAWVVPGGSSSAAGSAGPTKDHDITSSVGGGQPHNNMPPYVALLYCQKN